MELTSRLMANKHTPEVQCKPGRHQFDCTSCMKGDGVCDCGCFNEFSGWDYGDCDTDSSVENAVNALAEDVKTFIDNREPGRRLQDLDMTLLEIPPVLKCTKDDAGIHCSLKLEIASFRLVEIEVHVLLKFPEKIGLQAYVNVGPLDRLLTLELIFGFGNRFCLSDASLMPSVPLLDNFVDSMPTCPGVATTFHEGLNENAADLACSLPDKYDDVKEVRKVTGSRLSKGKAGTKMLYSWLADIDLCGEVATRTCEKYGVCDEGNFQTDQWLKAGIRVVLEVEAVVGLINEQVALEVACTESAAYRGSQISYPGPCYKVAVRTIETDVFEIVSSGACADAGLNPINDAATCDKAASKIGTYNGVTLETTSGVSNNVPRPEGCYVSASTGTLWLSVNVTNVGQGTLGTRHQVCKGNDTTVVENGDTRDPVIAQASTLLPLIAFLVTSFHACWQWSAV